MQLAISYMQDSKSHSQVKKKPIHVTSRALSETHVKHKIKNKLKVSWIDQVYQANHSAKVAILFRKNVPFIHLSVAEPERGFPIVSRSLNSVFSVFYLNFAFLLYYVELFYLLLCFGPWTHFRLCTCFFFFFLYISAFVNKAHISVFFPDPASWVWSGGAG